MLLQDFVLLGRIEPHNQALQQVQGHPRQQGYRQGLEQELPRYVGCVEVLPHEGNAHYVHEKCKEDGQKHLPVRFYDLS